jgi:hypothetical protein
MQAIMLLGYVILTQVVKPGFSTGLESNYDIHQKTPYAGQADL